MCAFICKLGKFLDTLTLKKYYHFSGFIKNDVHMVKLIFQLDIPKRLYSQRPVSPHFYFQILRLLDHFFLCPRETYVRRTKMLCYSLTDFFSIWVFFHKHSRFTGQQEKGEGISLPPLDHLYRFHIHLEISRTITTESSTLHITGSRTRTGNLCFPGASR